MTSKDKAVISLPVSPWDAILKAAKDQLPSLDSDSSLVSMSFLLVVNCPGKDSFRHSSTDPTLVYGLCFHLSVPGIISGYPLPLGCFLGLPELLSVDISALYLQGHSCVVQTPRWVQFQSLVFPSPPPCPAVALLSTLLGQVRASFNF